jgi:hypothetical protein
MPLKTWQYVLVFTEQALAVLWSLYFLAPAHAEIGGSRAEVLTHRTFLLVIVIVFNVSLGMMVWAIPKRQVFFMSLMWGMVTCMSSADTIWKCAYVQVGLRQLFALGIVALLTIMRKLAVRLQMGEGRRATQMTSAQKFLFVSMALNSVGVLTAPEFVLLGVVESALLLGILVEGCKHFIEFERTSNDGAHFLAPFFNSLLLLLFPPSSLTLFYFCSFISLPLSLSLSFFLYLPPSPPPLLSLAFGHIAKMSTRSASPVQQSPPRVPRQNSEPRVSNTTPDPPNARIRSIKDVKVVMNAKINIRRNTRLIFFICHLLMGLELLYSPLWPANTLYSGECQIRSSENQGKDGLGAVESTRFCVADALGTISIILIWHTITVFTGAARRKKQAAKRAGASTKEAAANTGTGGYVNKTSQSQNKSNQNDSSQDSSSHDSSVQIKPKPE